MGSRQSLVSSSSDGKKAPCRRRADTPRDDFDPNELGGACVYIYITDEYR